MSDIKHIGRIITTGKKCIVAYRTLPGDAYNCLIIPTESLPDVYHDALINLVESNAGQSAYEFAEALARTNFPDGSIMLAALHTQGKLIKIATDKIEMLPRPAVSINLAELNQIIAEQRGIPVDELSIHSTEKKPETEKVDSVHDLSHDDVSKTTSSSVNENSSENLDNSIIQKSVPEPVIDPSEDPIGAAKHYRSQADRLSKEAAQFRRMAEDLVPTVKKSKAKV